MVMCCKIHSSSGKSVSQLDAFSDAAAKHDIGLLDKIEKEIISHFDAIVKSTGEKITKICKLEKESWKVLDDEEEQCAKKIQMIEKAGEERVSN